MNNRVIIIGGGIAGLSCARHLHAKGIPIRIFEAAKRVGGRIKTDRENGFLLDRGFQVLQTAYPEARRMLDYRQLDLRTFAPGVWIRLQGRFYTVADPLRKPGTLLDTLRAPIGGLGDRLRLLHLAYRVTRGRLAHLFEQPETTAMTFLRDTGFSEAMITRFFVPFFSGVCLDPRIRASSRVLQYVLRMFAAGDAALPAMGMAQIPQQLAGNLPAGCIRCNVRVRQVSSEGVCLDDGTTVAARAVVLATEAPETDRLLGRPPSGKSIAETCLYFACDRADWHPPYLMLNGDGIGPINNIVIPSRASPAYAPIGKSLFGAVILGNPDEHEATLINQVQAQLVDWFGPEAAHWQHLKTYRIAHALPDQSPPTQNPTRSKAMLRPGLFVCGETGSLPGIQWAMVSGRRAADAVGAHLRRL